MKTISRAFVVSALAVGLVWTTSSSPVSGQGGPGYFVTRNGIRTPVYGTSVHQDADGNAVAECVRLTAPEIDAARIDRKVSRAMAAASPQATVTTDGAASFEIAYTDADGTGFNDTAQGATRRRAFEAALSAWSKVLKANIPIRVDATMPDLDDGDNNPDTMLLALGSPTEVWVIDNVGVPSALAWQKLNGRYSNAADSDITVQVNALADWDFSTTPGVTARTKSNMMYTLMHEVGHGLGFTDSIDNETGKLLNDPLPFGYDTFLNRGSSQKNRLLDHAAEEVKRDIVSNDLFFNGPNAIEASKKSIHPLPMVKLYAPTEFRKGSSIAHVDQDSYADVRTGLMAPIDFGVVSDKIDILTQAIMKDLGYTLVANPPVPNPNSSIGTRTRQ